ncbi:MAG: phage baseplate assembly protein V [Minicystis sp.]
MSTFAPDILSQIAPGKGHGSRLFGVVAGVVSDITDPEKRGRVKVKLPWLLDNKGKEHVTSWARVVAPGAGGNGRGLLLPLKLDDEVLVAFAFGNPEQPYVIGGLWNKETDKPPTYPFEDGEPNVSPDKRLLRSESGHTVVLDDTKDAEKITIADKGGKEMIELDVKNGKLSITADKELSIKVGSDVTLTAKEGKVTITCKELSVEASEKYAIAVGSSTFIKGESSKLALKGGKVTINDDALEVV